MRRIVLVALGAFVLGATLLPTQRNFTASADAQGERLAMFSKPAVVRIVDGAAGHPPGAWRAVCGGVWRRAAAAVRAWVPVPAAPVRARRDRRA